MGAHHPTMLRCLPGKRSISHTPKPSFKRNRMTSAPKGTLPMRFCAERSRIRGATLIAGARWFEQTPQPMLTFWCQLAGMDPDRLRKRARKFCEEPFPSGVTT